MKKEALAAIMATTLLVLSLLSPVTGAVGTSYAADSGGDSVSISESYDVDDTVTINETQDISFVDQGRTAEGTGEADGNATAAQETEEDAEPGHADSTEATIDDEVDNAPVATNKKDAIEDGLAWLETQQDLATGAWNLDYYPVGSTAFAVLKFEEHAWNILDIDPFSDDYIYKDNIVDGWKYIFEHAVCININMEGADNPDGDNDWKGVYFMSPAKNNRELERPVYETGIVMMALGASRQPGFPAPTPSGGMGTWTYLDYMQDMVDWVSWAQNDEQNYGVGGWTYGAYDDGALVQPAFEARPPGRSDNSVSQWPVIGLMSAAASPWGIKAPSWVTTELLKWLTYSQDLPGTGCFHYSGPGRYPYRINIANTAAGLIELTYCGVTTDDERWVNASRCICEKWNETSDDNIGNLYAMYGVMKAAMTADDDPIKKGLQPVKTFCGHDWQEEYDHWLVKDPGQNANGSWSPGPYSDYVLATEWALLILQKVVPPPPYCPLQSFEDLLKSQEKLIKSFEDLLNETWDELTPAKQLEFLKSFEDLLKGQEKLIKSFEDLLNMRWDKLGHEDQIGYLRSFEDLLKSQEELLFSFEDLLKRIDRDWVDDPLHYDLKESFEDLLKSQAELLFSFEDLLKRTWDELSPSEQLEFLESFEDLLKSQEKLIKSFEDMLNEEWDKLHPAKRIGYLRSFEELLKSQEELLFSFEDLLKRIEEDGLG